MVVATLLAAPAGYAQIKVHKTLNVEDGLVQSQVNAIYEDRDGFVWFGTFGGVSRWDGTEFRNFQTQDGLAALDVRVFYETADGAILIGTGDKGISVWRDGRLDTFDKSNGLPGNSVRAFDLARDGSLRVATSGGVVVFRSESLDTTGAVFLLPGKSVSALAKRRAGGFYASTFGDGVFLCRSRGVEPVDREGKLPGSIIRALHETNDGTLYISVYKHGLWLMKDGRFSRFAHNDRLDGYDVKAINPARDGSLYLSTLGGGIARYAPDGTMEFITEANGLANDVSWWVHEGASGVVYLGTWNGVSLYRPGRFITWNAASGLPEDIVGAMSQTPDGRYYAGTMGGGLAEIDGGVRRIFTTDDGLAHNRVWSLCTARDGTLYIGTHAGVNTLRDDRLETLFHEPTEVAGRVYDIHEAEDGTFYFATYGGVLVCRDGIVDLLYEEKDRRRSSVYSVCEGRDGEVYFGTGGGVVVYRNGSVEIPPAPSRLTEVRVWSVHQGSDGTMYFGTNGAGLLVMEGGFRFDGAVRALDVSNGLSDNTVYGILEDENGLLYLSTNRGVNVVDFSGPRPAVRHLGHSDGLASDECNQGPSFMDEDGRIWFSTHRGVSGYDPAFDPPNTTPPAIHITRVRLYENDVPLAVFAGEARFPHRDNYFKFDFVGTYPPSPGSVVYRYRLSRIDRDWVEAEGRLVQYTALPPGRYTFEVKAGNDWGYWSEPAAISFAITPPFWRTWWFVVLAIAVGGGLVWLIVMNRVRHLLAIERIRTRIAADLHDDIGATLTEISITSDVIAHKLPEKTHDVVSKELEHIGTSSRQLINSMSDIVWLVNPRRDSLHDLIARLGDAYNDTLSQSGISFKVQNLDALKNVRLGMERRQHIFLILKEAISNAIKYSDCTLVRLDVDATPTHVKIELSDNGKGFDTGSVRSGNGLNNMRERAEKSKTGIAIDSAPRQGTKITLKIRR